MCNTACCVGNIGTLPCRGVLKHISFYFIIKLTIVLLYEINWLNV